MLKIHEFSAATGALSSVYLSVAGEGIEIHAESEALPLPSGALAAVFTRFGAPFDSDARIDIVAELALPYDERLRHVRHLAGYDVIARDYLVYERAGEEALCVMSTTAASALLHLGRAAAR